jgi:hypothetical protein
MTDEPDKAGKEAERVCACGRGNDHEAPHAQGKRGVSTPRLALPPSKKGAK